MFSHVTVGSTDLEVTKLFYDAVLTPLRLVRRNVVPDGGPRSLCWVSKKTEVPRFYVYEPFNGKVATAGNGAMVAFSASSRAAVNVAYYAGIETGGRDAGEPGLRERYGAGYYGAYLTDPDGNKVHIVFRGDTKQRLLALQNSDQ